MRGPKFFDDLSEQLYNDLTTGTMFSKFFDVEICPRHYNLSHEMMIYAVHIVGDIQFLFKHDLCIPYRIGLDQQYDKIMVENDHSRKFIVESCTRKIQECITKTFIEVQKDHQDLIAMSFVVR